MYFLEACKIIIINQNSAYSMNQNLTIFLIKKQPFDYCLNENNFVTLPQ